MNEFASKRHCAIIAFLLVAPVSVVAQAPAAGNTNSFANIIPLPPASTAPAPRLADGNIDLSGVWRPADNVFIYDLSLGLPKGETLPLTSEALKTKAARLAQDDPEAHCLPAGVPRIAPFPWRIFQTPTHIFFLFEGNIHSYRQIFMDGRPHPPDPDPTWYGHSTGRWDKDTLIVDTVGFNDRSWFDYEGDPHTERLHTVERYTRPNLGTLTEEVTIDDPGAYTRPFTVKSTHRLLPNDELIEYVCQENEKDTAHLRGPAIPP